MATLIYRTNHPTYGPCGHRHHSISSAITCIDERRRPAWRCKCGAVVHAVRRPDRGCPACGAAFLGKEPVGVPPQHRIERSTDDGATWTPLTPDDLAQVGVVHKARNANPSPTW